MLTPRPLVLFSHNNVFWRLFQQRRTNPWLSEFLKGQLEIMGTNKVERKVCERVRHSFELAWSRFSFLVDEHSPLVWPYCKQATEQSVIERCIALQDIFVAVVRHS